MLSVFKYYSCAAPLSSKALALSITFFMALSNAPIPVKVESKRTFSNRYGILGLNILHYRKEQGMTQMQLAERANISKNHMQRIETAACSCTLDTLIDIAEALNIPLQKLFEFRD